MYGPTPLSRDQVRALIKQYFGFIQPDFAPIVVDTDNNLVAFGITLPSLSKALRRAKGRVFPFGFLRHLRALRVNDLGDLYPMAVRRDYQGKVVNAMLIARMIKVFNQFGIKIIGI